MLKLVFPASHEQLPPARLPEAVPLADHAGFTHAMCHAGFTHAMCSDPVGHAATDQLRKIFERI